MSGDGLVAPLNAPAAGQPIPGVQPGTSTGVVIANYVIVFGPTGTPTGLFVYTPGTTPAAGNQPIYSVTDATADPFGNPTKQGFVVYDLPGFLQMHINATYDQPAVEFATGVGSEENNAALYAIPVNESLVNELIEFNLLGPESTDDNGQALIQLVSAAADGSSLSGGVIYIGFSGAFTNLAHWNYEGFSIDAGSVTAVKPGTGTGTSNPAAAERWHTASITGTGYSAGSPAPAYKLYADNTAALTGLVSVLSGSAGATFLTLPSQYRPASVKKFPVAFNAGTPAAAANAQITVNTSGAVQFSAPPTGANFTFALDNVRFALDY